MTETLRFLLVASLFTVCLFGVAFLLTGCAVEGAGFENSGKQSRPVVCRKISAGFTTCRSI